jgi:predicted RNA-binding Zn-ribbon protein involved in translation (DUF1610 family)
MNFIMIPSMNPLNASDAYFIFEYIMDELFETCSCGCGFLPEEQYTDSLYNICPITGIKTQAKIGTVILSIEENNDNINNIEIKLAPFNRVNKMVERICTQCGNNIMAFSQVGVDLKSVYSCTCGYYDL